MNIPDTKSDDAFQVIISNVRMHFSDAQCTFKHSDMKLSQRTDQNKND